MLASKSHGANKADTVSAVNKKTAGKDSAVPRIAVNPIWQQFATRIGQRSGDNRPIIQRLCAECEEERSQPPIQTKLTVGAPDDEYEREADVVAERVMRTTTDSTGASVRRLPLLRRKTGSGDGAGSKSPPVTAATAERVRNPGPGEPLNPRLRQSIEAVLNADLAPVKLHRSQADRKAAEALGAKAFTHGRDIFLGMQQRPDDLRLLAHEATHVVQQQGFGQRLSAPPAEKTGFAADRRSDNPQWRRLAMRPAARRPGAVEADVAVGVSVSRLAAPALLRKPAQVTAYNFLGLPVGGGINLTMQDRLDDVADELRRRFTAVRGSAPADDAELRQWAGVDSMAGWRHRPGSTSKHCSGSAVDVNYRNQPYIVTRTGSVYGGEAAGSSLTGERRAAVEVYDRAVEFVYGSGQADVSARTVATATTPREITSSVYRRFRTVSDALAIYLGLAFHQTPDRVNRRPIAGIAGATEAQLLAGIPTSEREEESVGVENVRQYILSHEYDPGGSPDETYHWNWEDSFLAREYYFQMLRDYEFVRVPMVVGKPEARPPVTRNPVQGFLHMTEEFVVAMADAGNLRWGIADLSEAESGDTHHFDLGHHGGVTPDCN